jgi:hypothetical protein
MRFAVEVFHVRSTRQPQPDITSAASIDTLLPQRIVFKTSPLCLFPRAKSAPSQSSVFKREAMKSHLLSALMCLVLLVGAAFAAIPATELSLRPTRSKHIHVQCQHHDCRHQEARYSGHGWHDLQGCDQDHHKEDIRFVPVSAWLFPNNRILHGLLADDCRKT